MAIIDRTEAIRLKSDFAIAYALRSGAYGVKGEMAKADADWAKAKELGFKGETPTDTLTGKVIAVADGDTITVLHGKEQHRIRVSDIDCPERKQPFGTKAKQFTGELTFGETVTYRVSKTDRYGRLVARVILPDGRDLSVELVKAGLAWHYKKYSDDQELARLEVEARKAKRGLWSDANPVPPWEWRKEKR